MGMIYSASLYFGMVLSDGSTEHGGYHEALIGLGSILGPGTAALTQLVWRGDIRAGVAAVCCVDRAQRRGGSNCDHQSILTRKPTANFVTANVSAPVGQRGLSHSRPSL